MTGILDRLPARAPQGQGGRAGRGMGRPDRRRWQVARPVRPTHLRRRSLVALWVLALIGGVGLVMYGFGPVFHRRDQRTLIRAYRSKVDQAANEASGLLGRSTPTKAPGTGEPVAILEIGALHLQEVVVEGVDASQTRMGPGHVPGTAGPGQPGNSVLVGRAHGYDGPFGRLAALHKGARILMTTTQGQSVYEVASERSATVEPGSTRPGPDTAVAPGGFDEVYGPSQGNQLTLVTSAGAVPWNGSRAKIVVASLVGTPFAPTPQNGRSDARAGMAGERGATASVVLALMSYGLTMAASVVLYQRFRPATAYLLTIGPVVAATIVVGETLSRILPAWT